MTLSLRSLSVLFAVVISLSACGGADTTTNNGGSGGGQTSGGGEAPGAGVFMINNQSSTVICYAMISSHSDPNWGDDQLGDDTIQPGASYMWSAGSGVWDVKLQDCNHSTLLENTDGIDIQGAGTVLTVTD